MLETTVFKRDQITWLAYLILGFFAYLETLPGPLMPFLQAELRLSYGQASLHFGAFSLGVIIIGALGGPIIQYLGRWQAFWGGAFGMAVGVGMLAWLPWVAGTIAGAGLLGLAGTILLITTQTILSDHHQERRTIAFAESNVVAGLCAILATVAVGGLANSMWGWRASAGLAIVAVSLLFIYFRQVHFGAASNSVIKLHPGESARLPGRFWIYWAVMLLGSSVEWCFVFWGATFFERAVGFDKATAAASISIFFGAVVLGRWLGSRLAHNTGSRTILLLAQSITMLGFPLFWLAPYQLLNLGGLFIAGVGIGNFYPMTLATAVALAPHLPEQVSARLTLAMGLAGLTAPMVLGWLADQMTIQQAYVIVAPLLISAGLLVVLARR